MSRWDRTFWLRSFGPAYAILLLASLALAVVSTVPWVVAVAAAALGVTAGSLVRGSVRATRTYLGLLPALGSLAFLSVESPVGLVPDVLAGVAGLALLLWCAEDPDRAPGAFARGGGALAVPALGFAVALLSAYLLPAGLGTVGIAVGLLVVSLVAVLLLLSSPRTFEQDPSASS